jgi:hypothetical protein
MAACGRKKVNKLSYGQGRGMIGRRRLKQLHEQDSHCVSPSVRRTVSRMAATKGKLILLAVFGFLFVVS